MFPSGARDRCPQKGRLSHNLVWDLIAWSLMDSDAPKRCTGQVSLKGAPVPHPVFWDPMDLDPMDLDPMDLGPDGFGTRWICDPMDL